MTDQPITVGSGQHFRPVPINPTVAHSARVWNYWLGGEDNFEADRELGDRIIEIMPEIVTTARADRAFLGRTARSAVRDLGIEQFLDIGTGLPSANNTHEVAQSVAPRCRVVYVDNDPIVLAHAHALLTCTPPAVTDYIQADVRDPELILRGAARTLDFRRPVALMLLGILNFVLDTGKAHSVVNTLLDAMPSGSALVIAHPTGEVNDTAAEAVRCWNAAGATRMRLRTRSEIRGFFDGLELLEPGIVTCSQWRPDSDTPREDRPVMHFGGMGRKP